MDSHEYDYVFQLDLTIFMLCVIGITVIGLIPLYIFKDEIKDYLSTLVSKI